MGVRGLETFIKTQVPNGYFRIDVFEQIEDRKRTNPGEPVILIFDVQNMLHAVYDRIDPIQRFCGGNYKKLHDMFETFFRQLTIAGAKLVFFGDGAVTDTKFKTWCDRRNADYVKFANIFKWVSDTNASIPDVVKLFKSVDYSPSMTAGLKDLNSLCRQYGTYRVAIDIECDTEIAKYATENNALAVFGRDTDYMIYEGKWKYWSIKHLMLERQNYHTFEFDKQALREFLQLNDKKMVLFSMVAGNDVIPVQSLKKLHNKIHCLNQANRHYNYWKSHFLDIAKYVQTFPEVLTKDDIKLLSNEIFDSDNDDNLALIDDALKFYNTNVKSNLTDPVMLRLVSYHVGFYAILAGLPYSLSLPLYDLSRKDFMPFHDVLFPIFARIVGVIRQHIYDVNYVQIVETKVSHDEPYMAIELHPHYPPMVVPNLMDLIFNKGNNCQRFRFTLLKWVIFDDIHSTLDIEEIPKGYMVLLLTLMYLLRIGQISLLEADSILLTVYHINEGIEVDCVPPSHIDSSTLMVISLYNQLHTWIVSCFSLVGMTKFVDHLRFDGIVFLHLRNALQRLSNNNEAYIDALDSVRFYRSFLSQIPERNDVDVFVAGKLFVSNELQIRKISFC